MKKAMPDIDVVRKLIGDPQEFARTMRESDADFRLFMKRHGELGERFPDQYVAFYRGEVHAHGQKPPASLARSRRKGTSPRSAYRRVLGDGPSAVDTVNYAVW